MVKFGYKPLTIPEQMNIPGLTIEVGSVENLKHIRQMNQTIFNERRIINTFDRDDLLILEACLDGKRVGFKIGYRENRFTFYSAKGGVLPPYRRQGIALALLKDMLDYARTQEYQRFAFDSFPNLHPGMAIMALRLGYRIVKADYNSAYKEYRLRFETAL